MLQFVLGMLNSSSLLFFGVFVSAAILSIPFTRKNTILLLLFCLGVNVLHLMFYFQVGVRGTQRAYPILTHLTSVLLLVYYYKKSVLHSLYAITSAYLCCQLSKWFGMLAYALTGELWVEYGFRTAITALLGFIIIRYFASSLGTILTKPTKTVLIFFILPGAYYVFDYSSTVYTDLLYSGSQVALEFMPFVLCIAFLIFSILYFKEYEEKTEAKQQAHLLEIKREYFEKEVESIKRSEYQMALLRHDMRHFLHNISALIEGKESEKASAYIQEILKRTEQTARVQYSENETVNMILSTFEPVLKTNTIQLQHMIRIPKTLPVSDVDFTSILSNGLENAIHAVSDLPKDQRIISLELKMHNEKLLLSIRNSYRHPVLLEDGLPMARQKDHGLGTRSIQYVTEKLHGNCHFHVQENEFLLRVVL